MIARPSGADTVSSTRSSVGIDFPSGVSRQPFGSAKPPVIGCGFSCAQTSETAAKNSANLFEGAMGTAYQDHTTTELQNRMWKSDAEVAGLWRLPKISNYDQKTISATD